MAGLKLSSIANGAQSILASPIYKKDSSQQTSRTVQSINSVQTAATARNSPNLPFEEKSHELVFFSQEGRKSLEEQKETEKQNKIQNAWDDNRVKAGALSFINDQRVDWLVQKIGDITVRLKQLKDQIRQVMMYGDKRSAAAIAKEAAALAKELTAAIRAVRARGKSSVPDDSEPMPKVDTDNSEESPDGAEGSENDGNVENVENIENLETPDAIDDPEAIADVEDVEDAETIEEPDGITAEQAVDEAEEALEEAEEEAEEREDAQSSQSMDPKGARQRAMERVMAIFALSATDDPEYDVESVKREAVVMLKEIASMVRQTFRQKGLIGSVNIDSQQDQALEKDTERTLKDLGEAIAEVESA